MTLPSVLFPPRPNLCKNKQGYIREENEKGCLWLVIYEKKISGHMEETLGLKLAAWEPLGLMEYSPQDALLFKLSSSYLLLFAKLSNCLPIDHFLTCSCKLTISTKNSCLRDTAILVKDYILEKFSAASSPCISGPILFGAIPHYPALYKKWRLWPFIYDITSIFYII